MSMWLNDLSLLLKATNRFAEAEPLMRGRSRLTDGGHRSCWSARARAEAFTSHTRCA
jgi:hypothetical protein